jgi:hypothetical protein
LAIEMAKHVAAIDWKGLSNNEFAPHLKDGSESGKMKRPAVVRIIASTLPRFMRTLISRLYFTGLSVHCEYKRKDPPLKWRFIDLVHGCCCRESTALCVKRDFGLEYSKTISLILLSLFFVSTSIKFLLCFFHVREYLQTSNRKDVDSKFFL